MKAKDKRAMYGVAEPREDEGNYYRDTRGWRAVLHAIALPFVWLFTRRKK